VSDSDVTTAPAVQDEAPVQKPQEPGFGELKEQILCALATYKKRGENITALEQALSQARKAEADCLKRSLTDDDPKVVKRIAEARVEIEVASRRLTFSQQSLPGSLEDVVVLMRQLQARLVQQLSDLKAERTKAHYAVLSAELDSEAVAWFSARRGLGTDLLWTLAALSPDVLTLERLFPYLTWVHDRSVELTLKRVESDIELLFAAVQKFETEVLQTES
jgi:hypothetical protein